MVGCCHFLNLMISGLLLALVLWVFEPHRLQTFFQAPEYKYITKHDTFI